MGDNKLYEVKVEFTYYAHAETEDAARDFAEEALRDSYIGHCTTARRVTHKAWPIKEGWEDDSIIYAIGFFTRLKEAMKSLPETIDEVSP